MKDLNVQRVGYTPSSTSSRNKSEGNNALALTTGAGVAGTLGAVGYIGFGVDELEGKDGNKVYKQFNRIYGNKRENPQDYMV
jgi:hypothetical protein